MGSVLADNPNSTIQASRHRSAPLNVFIVDDSAVLVDRFIESFRDFPRLHIIGSAATEAEALHLIKIQRVDILVLDLQLRQGTGFGVLRALPMTKWPELVVVLTNHDIPEFHTAADRLGVAAFLDKASACGRLPEILLELAESRHLIAAVEK